MFETVKKWFQIGGPVYNENGWSGNRRLGPSGPHQPATPDELATLSGVNRACTLFSDSAASQPWRIRQTPPQGGYFDIMGSDAAHALNEWGYEGRELWLFSAALLGNGYAIIHRNERGGPMTLESIAPWRVSLEWTDAKLLTYRVAEDENTQQPDRCYRHGNC
jgi:phage portal protein BeeE